MGCHWQRSSPLTANLHTSLQGRVSELPGTQGYLMSMQMRTSIKARPGADMCSPRNHTGVSLFRRLRYSLQYMLASLLSASASQVLLPVLLLPCMGCT